MFLEIKNLETSINRTSPEPIVLFFSDTSLQEDDLSERERILFEKTPNKKLFLISRKALKKAMYFLSMGTDTSLVSFPHSQLSLSHSNNIALAVACKKKIGIGVDIEKTRNLDISHGRLFLSEEEMKDMKSLTAENLTERWTIKEAAYKANISPDQGHLRDYRIFYEISMVKKGDSYFSFLSHKIEDFFVSVCYKSDAY